MADFELAQLNVAAPLPGADASVLAEFYAGIARINALADTAPGFVWRLKDGGDAEALAFLGEGALINLSVWRDVESLGDYVYRSGHIEVMRRRAEWFRRVGEAHLALWWVPAGHRPNLTEAAQRLAGLRRDGPSAQAFGFRGAFPPPG